MSNTVTLITVDNFTNYADDIRDYAESVQADYEYSPNFSFEHAAAAFATIVGATYADQAAVNAVKRQMRRNILEELGYEF